MPKGELEHRNNERAVLENMKALANYWSWKTGDQWYGRLSKYIGRKLKEPCIGTRNEEWRISKRGKAKKEDK